MSDAAWTILGQFIVAVVGGGVIVAVIQSLLYPKTKWDRVRSERIRLNALIFAQQRQARDGDPLVALERSAFAPIEDAVREGEERAVREWDKTPAERDPHEDYLRMGEA